MGTEKTDLTPEELEEMEKEALTKGPLSVLTDSVKNGTQVDISTINFYINQKQNC